MGRIKMMMTTHLFHDANLKKLGMTQKQKCMACQCNTNCQNCWYLYTEQPSRDRYIKMINEHKKHVIGSGGKKLGMRKAHVLVGLWINEQIYEEGGTRAERCNSCADFGSRGTHYCGRCIYNDRNAGAYEALRKNLGLSTD